MDVELSLFGPPRLRVDGSDDATRQVGSKGMALLAYLALEPGSHARTELAALLWSDSSKGAARASLRQTLRQLRAVLGEAVVVGRTEVSLTSGIRCDACAFLEARRRGTEDAVEFPVDRFLAGFAVRHAAGFEEWAGQMRQRLLSEFREGIRGATLGAAGRSRWRDVVRWAERWRAVDPLAEEAARALIEGHFMAGDRGEALAAYHAYRQVLADEAGAEPPAALRDLAERISRDQALTPRTPASDAEIPAQSFDPSLLGRESEWECLTRVWRTVAEGHGRVVLVQGEPGVGKTRLAEDLLQWIVTEGGTVLRGRGLDPELGVAYAPLVEAFRSAIDAPGLASADPAWLAELARIVPELRHRFLRLPEPSSPGDTDRRWRLFESAVQAILGIASERPTAIFVDDLQRCDPDSCAFIHFAAQRLRAAPVLIIATVTLGEVERVAPASRLCRALRSGTTQATVLTLGPLSGQDILAMIRELGRVSTSDGARRFAAHVHAVTDGNPFHTVELLKSLFLQGVLKIDPATGEWLASSELNAEPFNRTLMPATVHDAISARCTGLAYELRDLLVTISVAGRAVDTELLSLIHGLSRLRAAALADELVNRRLLAEEDGVYAPAHPVIQDVIRSDVTPARRREVHRAIALALESVGSEDRLGEIARHAERGGEPALAYRAGLGAAERAAAEGAFEEALSWLDLAAQVAEPGAQARAVDERTAEVLARAGWPTPPKLPERRIGTPARGFVRHDLDLRHEGP